MELFKLPRVHERLASRCIDLRTSGHEHARGSEYKWTLLAFTQAAVGTAAAAVTQLMEAIKIL